MAIEFDIVPWAKGEAKEAALWAFGQWRKTHGESAYEDRQAIEQVRGIIERYGESRFDDRDPPKTGPYGDKIERRPVSDRLGFREGTGDDRRNLAKRVDVRGFGNKRFYVLTPKLFEES
jgi:uncharacterized protein (DUF927 family)